MCRAPRPVPAPARVGTKWGASRYEVGRECAVRAAGPRTIQTVAMSTATLAPDR